MSQIAHQYESAIEARDQAHERMRHLKSVLDYCLIHDVDPVQAQLSMPSDQKTEASHKTKGGGHYIQPKPGSIKQRYISVDCEPTPMHAEAPKKKWYHAWVDKLRGVTT
jgi:hypothetical protein